MSPWPRTTLGKLMPERRGTVDPSKFPDELFDLYSIPAFDSGSPVVVEGREIGSTKQVVQPGDVLVSKIVPHIRRAWVVGKSGGRRLIASSEWIVFEGVRAYPRYLRHILVSDRFHAQFMKTVAGVGGSLLRARPTQVARIEIPLPPLSEQRRIAAILDKADELRAKRRAALEQLNALRTSTFVSLFGDPQSILARWKVVELGDALTFLTSGSRGWARYYRSDGALFLRIQNVRNDELRLDDVAYVDAPDTAESKRTRVQTGDVLLSITADLGRTAVIPENIGTAYINQHLAIVRTRAFSPRFLSAFLASGSGRRQIVGKNRQGVKAGLNFDDIRSLIIPTPPISLQREFEQTMTKIDNLEELYRRSQLKGASLFASMHNQLSAEHSE